MYEQNSAASFASSGLLCASDRGGGAPPEQDVESDWAEAPAVPGKTPAIVGAYVSLGIDKDLVYVCTFTPSVLFTQLLSLA